MLDNAQMKTIGERIQFVRDLRGWSQAELAKRVGISQGTIGHIESGRNENSKHLAQIALVLRVRAEWLSSGRGDMYGDWPFSMPMTDYQKLNDDQKETLDKMITGYIVGCLSISPYDNGTAHKKAG